MTYSTSAGTPIDGEVLVNYFDSLVNLFFKILPIKESKEKSLVTYMSSLQAELLGCRGLVEVLRDDSLFLSLASILQYLIDNPDCEVKTVKREVFKAISICNKLKEKYMPQSCEEAEK